MLNKIFGASSIIVIDKPAIKYLLVVNIRIKNNQFYGVG